MTDRKKEEFDKVWKELTPLQARYIVLLARVYWMEHKVSRILRRIDLWFFPPTMFVTSYKAISQLVPSNHPMALYTLLATSFMSATITLFLLRPAKKKNFHWIKS
jgi:hypothetical protein